MLLKEEMRKAPGDFGHILKDIRMKRGYTREQLPERVGISTRYLSAIENEQREPSYRFCTIYFIVLEFQRIQFFIHTPTMQTIQTQNR